MSSLLENEFKIIQSDILEKNNYPATFADFKKFALKNINEISKNKKYFPTFLKTIGREGPRKLYFFDNELEAIARIFSAIESDSTLFIDISNLSLLSLPPILKKIRHLEGLNISGNSISGISLLSYLPEIKEFQANSNQITDIGVLSQNAKLETLFLNHNNIKTTYKVLQGLPKLKILELVGNRINDTHVLPILKNTSLEEINLNSNPLGAPLTILTDLTKLREFYKIKIQPALTTTTEQPTENSDASNTEELAASPEIRSSATGRISLIGRPAEDLLDVKKLSKIFYEFIADCESNVEQFFGLFGRWGRGKTFFAGSPKRK
jgi:Leucine rich repeat